MDNVIYSVVVCKMVNVVAEQGNFWAANNVMGIEDYADVKHILVILIPLVVNLVYYPVLYWLMRKGVFKPDMIFICMMFGGGMAVHLVCSIACFAVYRRRVSVRPCRTRFGKA